MTRRVIPVDLNAYFCRSEGTLARMHKALGNEAQSNKYAEAKEKRKQALFDFFWSPQESQWLDMHLGTPQYAFTYC
jgi:neutral trehalase